MSIACLLMAAVIAAPQGIKTETAPVDPFDQTLVKHGVDPTPKGILNYIRPLTDKRLQELVAQLGADEYEKRQKAMNLLSELPVVPVQALESEMRVKRDPEIRYRVEIILKRSRQGRNEPVIFAVMKKMRGKDYAEAAPILLDLIPQLNKPHLVSAAAEALRSVADARHADGLRSVITTSGHEELRIAAIQTLAKAVRTKAADDLKGVLSDKSDRIRMTAAAALLELDDRDGLPTLGELLKSDNVSIRAGASWYLRNATGQRFGFLAVDKSEARVRAAGDWIAWIKTNGKTAKLKHGALNVLIQPTVLSVSGKLAQSISGHESSIYGVAASPDGKLLASVSGDGRLKVWDAKTGKVEWELAAHEGATVYGVAFSHDGKRLATAGYDHVVKLWDIATRKALFTLKGHTNEARTVAFSPDDKRLVSTSNDRHVIIWDTTTGKALHKMKGHSSIVRAAVFSPKGDIVASASSDQKIILWDVKTGKEIKQLNGHRHSVRSVAFSPDGRTLASGSYDNTVRLWDVLSGQERVTLSGHSSSVKSVDFSTNGRVVVSGGSDKCVRIWDADTGRLIATLTGPRSSVETVTLTPDGKRVIAAGSDREIRVWDLDFSNTGAPVSPAKTTGNGQGVGFF